MAKNQRINSTSAKGTHDRRREVVGVVGLGTALFLLIAMISLQAGAFAGSGANVMGPFGRTVAGLFYGTAGMCGYLAIAVGIVAAIRMLVDREPALPAMVALGALLGIVALATLVHLVAPRYRVAGHGPGGMLGEHLAEILRAMISTAGTALLALVGVVVAVVIATPLRMRDVLHALWTAACAVGRAVRTATVAFTRFWTDVARAILPDRERDVDDDVEVDDADVL